MKACFVALLCVMLFALPSQSWAHTDMGLNYDEEGVISGLPEEYGPGYFSWSNRRLRIGNHQVNLRSFENVIPAELDYDVSLFASWYHQRSLLPPYIYIRLNPHDKPFSYQILFHLETLELIHVSLSYRIELESGSIKTMTHQIALPERTLQQIQRHTTEIR